MKDGERFMSREGAMLGGYFLPEKEFKSLMIQLLKENRSLIENYLNAVILNIEAKKTKEAYITWTKFQTDFLKNPTTSLLAITNFYGSGAPQTWNFFSDEVAAIQNNGLISISSADTELKRAYNSDVLASHLSGLFKSISGTKMTEREVNFLYSLKRKDMLEALNQYKGTGQKAKYKEIIYRKIGGRYYAGKVADAYLNHLGKHHWNYLNRFSQGDMTGLEHLRNASVRTEELSKGYLNFVQLLLDSLNSTGWQTGGDLIVTDSGGKIVANIQLKTSASTGDAIGRINTKKLAKDILKIKQNFSQNDLIVANSFYDLLKTSTVTEGLGDAIIQEGYELAAKTLGVQIV